MRNAQKASIFFSAKINFFCIFVFVIVLLLLFFVVVVDVVVQDPSFASNNPGQSVCLEQAA